MVNLLRFLLFLLFELLKGVAYKWALAIFKLLKAVFGTFRRFWERIQLPHADRNATNERCGTIQNPSFHRPDPLIYSQKYLSQLGLAVTWDNPDIVLKQGGAVVSEGDLLPDTDYEIEATIWNNSYDAPCVGLRIDFTYLSFGAATTQHPIGTAFVNLGVKGGVNHPARASVNWRTPPTGHYCIQVDLVWADDLVPANNMGQNNVNVVEAQSPAVLKFLLRNDTNRDQTYTFPVDTYSIPELRGCSERDAIEPNTDRRWRSILALHDRTKYPIPDGWVVNATPSEVTLGSGDDTEIKVQFSPPISFIGTQAFNVHAMLRSGRYAGGVTAYITKS